jgi:hypothetical protein
MFTLMGLSAAAQGEGREVGAVRLRKLTQVGRTGATKNASQSS